MFKVKHVTKIVNSGKNKLTILEDINLEIPRKEILSICGPSGSGKSTLLAIMSGMDRPTIGEIMVDDCSLYTLNEKNLARFRNEKIGIIFQNSNLIPSLSVIENVNVPHYLAARGKKSRLKAEDVLELLGIGDKIKVKIGNLSGGEQQRVAIARALIQEPDFLFADEPTGSLDHDNSMAILELLKRINQEWGTTVILVTHDMEIANKTDRIIYLNQGKIHIG